MASAGTAAAAVEPFRFALISDVHVWNGASMSFGDYLTKRLTGYLNIRFLRGEDKYPQHVLRAALEDMREQRVQHLIVAGDITNLALESEFKTAAEIIGAFSPDDPSRITACPGNHDSYHSSAVAGGLFDRYFGCYARCDTGRRAETAPGEDAAHGGFPFVQRRGALRILGLNSSVPTAPFSARGYIGAAQMDRARELMQASADDGAPLLNVAVVHHPPLERQTGLTGHLHELSEADRVGLAQLAQDAEIDLVVHGHLHTPFCGELANERRTEVIEAGSGTLMSKEPETMARYNVFDVDPRTGTIVSVRARVWQRAEGVFADAGVPRRAKSKE